MAGNQALQSRSTELRGRTSIPAYIAGMALLDVALAAVLRGCRPQDTLTLCSLAFVMAQGVYIAILGAIAPWRRFDRAIVCVGFGVVLVISYALLTIPTGLGPIPEYWWRELVTFTSLLPLIGLAVQTPLWIAKALWGWRLAAPGMGCAAAKIRPLGIPDLLICTAVVAFALGMARAGLIWSQEQTMKALSHSSSPNVGVKFTIYVSLIVPPALLGLSIALPAAFIVFRAKAMGWAITGLMLAQAAAASFFVGGICFTTGFPSDEDLVQMLIFHAVFFTPLDVLLFAMRRSGYRLYWRTSKQKRMPSSASAALCDAT